MIKTKTPPNIQNKIVGKLQVAKARKDYMILCK
jgi:hypothetical protein